MGVKSLDARKDVRAAALASVQQLYNDGKVDEAAESLIDVFQTMQDEILEDAKQLVHVNDAQVLASRGVRQLTSDEKQFWTEFISAAKSSNPRQAVTNLDTAMPKTTINAVFEDLEAEHPLLNAIDFQNTTGVVEWLIHKGNKQLATWSALCGEIVKELAGDFELLQLTMAKLSAFIPICKAMLDLGPEWLDRYVRTILGEALAFGLEEGILNGNGLAQPIGMSRNLAAAVDPVTGYAAKAAVPITTLDAATYGQLLATLATTSNGYQRKVTDLILVVSPADYYSKVMPATTYLNPLGQYVSGVLPFPTEIIVSEQMAEGEAIIGMGKKYFFGLGAAKSGKIEYSDEYHFLEDERIYLTKLYGMGKPKDNTSFLRLDISGLVPALPKIEAVLPPAPVVPEEPDPDIAVTFTATEDGGTAGTTDSTAIVLTFDKDVVGLTADHITLAAGTGSATKGALTGSAKAWSLAITDPTEGTVTVLISGLDGYSFTETPTSVTVYSAP